LRSFSFKTCTVSDVIRMPNRSYGFNILNKRVQPVLSLVFERWDDAEQARVEVTRAMSKVVEVTRPALTAAGEP
jgi:hypothetical protein